MTDPRPEDRPAAPTESVESAAAEPQPTGAPAEPVTPATAQVPAAEQPAADPRPRPAYGEYAPEGWSWTPPQEPGSAEHPPQAEPARPAGHAAGAQTPAPAAGDVDAEVPARLPGVPHNLGAPAGGRGSASSSTTPAASTSAYGVSAPPAPGAPASNAGTQQQQQPHAAHQVAPAQAPLPQGAPAPRPAKPRTADRIITVLLLVMGAFGALNIAFELSQLTLSQQKTAEMLGVTGYEAPSWTGPAGIVAAIAVLAIYAVNLILSVRRLRANKLTFFVPLIAGVVAFLVFFALVMAATIASPELMQAAQDPDAISKLFENIGKTGSN